MTDVVILTSFKKRKYSDIQQAVLLIITSNSKFVILNFCLEQGLIGNSIEMTKNTVQVKIFKKCRTYLVGEV